MCNFNVDILDNLPSDLTESSILYVAECVLQCTYVFVSCSV